MPDKGATPTQEYTRGRYSLSQRSIIYGHFFRSKKESSIRLDSKRRNHLVSSAARIQGGFESHNRIPPEFERQTQAGTTGVAGRARACYGSWAICHCMSVQEARDESSKHSQPSPE